MIWNAQNFDMPFYRIWLTKLQFDRTNLLYIFNRGVIDNL